MRTLTSCTLDCSDTCSLYVEIKPDGSLHISGNPDHPFTAGVVCEKTRRYARILGSPHRVTTPLLRERSGWREIGWEAALDLCAAKIQDCRKEPASILHIFDVGNKGLLPLLSWRFFGELGATRAAGSLCDTAGIAACQADFGALDSNDITDLINAQRIVNWGKDLSRSSLHTGLLVQEARRRGAEVLTISPGGDGNSAFTDYWLRIRPGADRFLAAAAIRRLIEMGRIAADTVERAANWPDFRDLVMSHSLTDLTAACDMSATHLESLLAFYTEATPVATIIGLGLQRYTWGGETVRFINALAFLSGHIGQSGGGVYYNISSSRNFNMDWAFAPGEESRRTFRLPTIGRDILAADGPPVRFIWVNGCNVVNQAPDARAVARAFEQTEFVVVADAFMNDTAERANLILPCTLNFEREDIIGSFTHNYIHYVAPAVQPPAGARPDHWMVAEIGRRLSPPVLLPEPETCLRAALDSPYVSFSFEELKRRGWARASRPQVAFEGLRFSHPDGLYHFPEKLHPEPPPPDGYPLRLLSLIRREAIHSQILPEDHPPTPWVWVAPDCPALAELDPEREAYLVSPLGRMRVRVKTMPGLHPGACLYRRDDWMKLGGGPNQLIAAGLTDLGEGAPYYDQYVRLEQ